jgi:hypothetical protein
MRRRFAIASIVVLYPAIAHAQVNIERLRSDLKDAPATATLEGSFTGRTGNVESVVFGGAGTGAAKYERNRFFASTSLDYARFAHKTTVSKSFVHIRYNYELLEWLYAEAFVQQQQDKFQRLLLRELAGAGPRFVVVDEDDMTLALGTAAMLEYERIAVAAGAADEPETLVARSSSYVSATWKPDSRVRALGTIYLQPRFDDLSDVRVLFETSLVTDVTKRLGVKVIATVRYDSLPPTEVKTTDLEVKNALVLKF